MPGAVLTAFGVGASTVYHAAKGAPIGSTRWGVLLLVIIATSLFLMAISGMRGQGIAGGAPEYAEAMRLNRRDGNRALAASAAVAAPVWLWLAGVRTGPAFATAVAVSYAPLVYTAAIFASETAGLV